MIADDDFEFDAEGNRVLLGLTFSETIEFDRLEKYINETGPYPHIDRDQWHRSEEKRWLTLWDKHQAAKIHFWRHNQTRH